MKKAPAPEGASAARALAALGRLLPDDAAVQQLGADPSRHAQLRAALHEGLALADPKLLARVEELRLQFPAAVGELPSTPALDAARASAVLGRSLQAFTQLAGAAAGAKGSSLEKGVAAAKALEGTAARHALAEAYPALSLNPGLLEPSLSQVPGAAEALLLLAPARGDSPSLLTAELVEAARQAALGKPKSEGLSPARERLIGGALVEAEAQLSGHPGLDVAGLAGRLGESAKTGEAPLLRWAMSRPSPVIFRDSKSLQTIALALHQLRFPPATPGPSTEWGVLDRTPASQHRFVWEDQVARSGVSLERVLQDFHRVATDATEYRARTLDEVIEDLGPQFAKRLDTLGPNDVLFSIGARSGHAERQLYARRGDGAGPLIVAADVIAPSGEEHERFMASGPHPDFRCISGQYVEELDDAVLSTLVTKEGGKVVVADNYAAFAYGSEPHAVLRKLSFLPPGSEVHTTLPYENRTFIDRAGTRAAWPEYFEAVEGYRVKSIVPNGDVYQVVLERTEEEFRAPVLELTAIEPHGGPPGRRFTWTNGWISQADRREPRIARIRRAGPKPPLELA